MKTKTLNPKLSKRLNDLGLLEKIESEYHYSFFNVSKEWVLLNKGEGMTYQNIKTLTESEAIEFLPSFNLEKINFKDEEGNVVLRSYNIILGDFETGKMKELIFAIEKYFEYLLDNNLLTK